MMHYPRKSSPVTALLSFLLMLLIGCAVTGPGGKTSLIFIGTDTEVSIGAGMDSTIRKDNPILRNAAAGVNLKGHRLLAEMAAARLNGRPVEWPELHIQ